MPADRSYSIPAYGAPRAWVKKEMWKDTAPYSPANPMGWFGGEHVYLFEKRYLNNFRQEYVPTRREVTTERQVILTRPATDGSLCWDECQAVYLTSTRDFFIVVQEYEIWLTNLSLSDWLDAGGGSTAQLVEAGGGVAAGTVAPWLANGAVSVGVGVFGGAGMHGAGLAGAGAVGLAGAGAAASMITAAGTFLGVVGAAVGGWQVGTAIASLLYETTELKETAWELVDAGLDPPIVTRAAPVWEECSERVPCLGLKESTVPPTQEGQKSGLPDGFPWLPWFVWVLVAVALGAGAFIVFRGDDDPDPAPVAASSTTATTAASSSTTTTSTEPAPLGGTVTGTYEGTVEVDEDPAGHACCVDPAETWTVLQTLDTTTGVITIRVAGMFEGAELAADIADSGVQFAATTSATIADRPGTEVRFEGTVTPTDGIDGVLTVGANGTLPTGQPITFTVDLDKVG